VNISVAVEANEVISQSGPSLESNDRSMSTIDTQRADNLPVESNRHWCKKGYLSRIGPKWMR